MAPDSITKVTSESWFSRIGNAVKGIIIGFILFIVAFPLLFWNEGRAVKTYKTLKEGSGAVVSVSADAVDAGNEGKLVHISGEAVTDDVLADAVFGVSANAIRLERKVEMYQWTESQESNTKKKVGGGTETTTTYKYSMAWEDSAVDSSRFEEPTGHQNPGTMLYTGQKWDAKNVTVGAFRLSGSLVGKIGGSKQLAVGSDVAVPGELEGKAVVLNNMFYIGADPKAPKIGDIKVSFAVVEPAEVSIIAQQDNGSFKPYQTKAGGTIERLQMGAHTAAAMFEQAQNENKTLTWILRLFGFILMMIGLNLVLRPLAVVADVLPILGTIVGAGTGLISFLVASALSIITVAVAWIVYRPLLGVALLAVAVGLAVVVGGKLKKAKAVE